MKRLLTLLAALGLSSLALAGQTPLGIFGGAPTFAQLPGNISLTFSAAPTGASATLFSAFTGTTGSYLVVFSDWESRTVTLTSAATTATWTGSLVGTPTATATIDGYTTPPASPTYAYSSDLGLVYSTGTAWVATAIGASGAPLYISSGCATVSATKGTAAAGQFTTTATTCTPVIQLPPASYGWVCVAQDITHPVVFTETAQSTYSCTVTGTTTSGDVVVFEATPY